MSSASDKRPVRVYLCECGPIIKSAIDLDQLELELSANENVAGVTRHSTLCSEQGREWMAEDLEKHPDSRVVVVGCSPREHGTTFKKVCHAAKINPYLLAMANIREQCAWVTPDKDEAAAKALALSRAAVSRVMEQQPLEELEIDTRTDVMVIGAGVAGMTAAKMLAEGDHKVYLVERTPAVGGRTALLGDVYPNYECASCMIEPLMDDVLHHPNIEVLTYTEVEEVLGYLGNFTVRLRKRARHVDPEACYGCRTCHGACPVKVPNSFDDGLSERGAVFIPYEGALPNATLVDEASCLHFNGEECDACVAACPFGSIDLGGEDELVERQAGSIVLATGAATSPLEADAPGGVISAMTLERILNSAGPTGGEVELPGRGAPKSVALIHCADGAGAAPVSSCDGICCMNFSKYAHQIHEKLPGCEITRFVWERCAGGKGFRQFAAEAERESGVKAVNLGASDRIEGLAKKGDQVEIAFTRDGKKETTLVDMVVLSPPLIGAEQVGDLAARMRVELDGQGFVKEEHERLLPFRTRLEGIYVAGCARGPGDIQDAAAQGAAAAGAVLASLVEGRKLTVEPTAAEVDPELCGGCHTCVLTCPYQAVTFDEEKRTAVVNQLLCRGCGSCAAGCPAGAIVHCHFTDRQLEAEFLSYLV